MNIKDGDIITLQDGTRASVKLTKIEEVKELIPGSYYQLKRNDQFCHLYTTEGNDYNVGDIDLYEFQYIGKVSTKAGERYIFSLSSSSIFNVAYAMFSARNLGFVIKKIK